MTTTCHYCNKPIARFDKAPADFRIEGSRQGWALDESGDVDDDFICGARESTGRWPDGKPHEPTTTTDREATDA